MAQIQKSLSFEVRHICGKARSGVVTTAHGSYETPVFMPVGTQGTIKGLFPEQIKNLNCHMLLGNTYHLELHPGTKIMSEVGGLHKFMNWDRSILTDSGGFQMVSLLALSSTSEQGVEFSSPRDGSMMMLTPEKSIEIQEAIGSDIAMQLDDVIKTTTQGERVVEAMNRSCRWLDRCLKAHSNPNQCIFGIIQGGLNESLREECTRQMTQNDLCGFAIGGLSGGEEKASFSKIVKFTSELLPFNKPKYCMGVGYLDDILVCVYHGIDMFDCVYPTRTARFGTVLTARGNVNLRHKDHEKDFGPIDPDCSCFTCKNYTRSYLHMVVTKVPSACHLLTIHNLHFYMEFMSRVRRSIAEGTFESFLVNYFKTKYPEGVPDWIIGSLGNLITPESDDQSRRVEGA